MQVGSGRDNCLPCGMNDRSVIAVVQYPARNIGLNMRGNRSAAGIALFKSASREKGEGSGRACTTLHLESGMRQTPLSFW